MKSNSMEITSASTSAIDKLYAKKCELEGKNFFTVPQKNQGAVRMIIESDGYIILEDGTVVLIDMV